VRVVAAALLSKKCKWAARAGCLAEGPFACVGYSLCHHGCRPLFSHDVRGVRGNSALQRVFSTTWRSEAFPIFLVPTSVVCSKSSHDAKRRRCSSRTRDSSCRHARGSLCLSRVSRRLHMHAVTAPVGCYSIARLDAALSRCYRGDMSLTGQWHHGWSVEAFLQTTAWELDAGTGLSIDVRRVVLHPGRACRGGDWQPRGACGEMVARDCISSRPVWAMPGGQLRQRRCTCLAHTNA
jgi:hypothetical protein